ncbi:urease accessory protein UreD [Mrakia frigida]|uniref:urease accessory protein UreD n=1 Tax=Mrakia frigida TaxID=29902 RepID=UPI003FCC08E9
MSPTSSPPGTGSIHLLPSSQFSHLSFSYPLKLLSPIPLRSSQPGLRVVYMLSYGGGLVSGDKIWIDVVVEGGATLVVLTQGTTKVFKRRPRGRLSTSAPIQAAPSMTQPPVAIPPSPPLSPPVPSTSPRTRLDTTTQTLITTLHPGAALYLLPSPTACFVSSRYTQRQRFDLPTCGTANLVVLDWFTCGREKSTGGGESWGAERMEFFAEVWWGGKRGVGERIVLEDENSPVQPLMESPSGGEGGGNDQTPSTTSSIDASKTTSPPSLSLSPPPPHITSYSTSLLPYTIYATLLLTGPSLQSLLTHLLHLQATEPKIMHLPHNAPRRSLLWSLSILDDRNVEGMGRTGMVRVCGVDGEEVRTWLAKSLGGFLPELIGGEVWERAVG